MGRIATLAVEQPAFSASLRVARRLYKFPSTDRSNLLCWDRRSLVMAIRRFDEGWCQEDEDLDVERQIAIDSRDWLFSNHMPAPAQDRLPANLTELPVRILLAEDDADMRGLLARALTQEGFLVIECSNGIQLLDHLSGLFDRRPLEPFDVIISDIRMPGLTGLEILEGLQGDGDLPPTILITAFGDEATHHAARVAGAVITLDKPFEVEELLAIVRRVLGQGHGT
jgi:CheY-like chemotaxis protein